MNTPVLWAFSPEAASQTVHAMLRAHQVGCLACRTEECEDGARMRRALRAVHTVLQGPEPARPTPDEAARR